MALVFTLIFVSLKTAAFESSALKLPTGRSVVAELEAANSHKRWIVFLPGSTCGLYLHGETPWLATLNSAWPANVLVINKAGVGGDNRCRMQEFKEGSLRQNRIDDVLAALKLKIPDGEEILLVGESEGGYIAPDIALQYPGVRGLVLISGGTRSWLDEEVARAPEAKRASLRAMFDRDVVGSTDFEKTYLGWTYAQLASYNTNQTVTSLRALQIPVAAFHGEDDKNIWVSAAISDFSQLIEREGKSNLHSYVIQGAAHGLHCASEDCSSAPPEAAVCEKLLSFAREIP
jgi:pimeloyl-ACP methyl ester carboxylesterase